MKFYITEQSIPELQNLPPIERKAVQRAFARRPFFWLTVFGMVACLLGLAAFLGPFDPDQPDKQNVPTWLLVVLSGVISLSWAQLFFGRLHVYVRDYIRTPRLLLAEPAVQGILGLRERQKLRLFVLHAAWSNTVASIERLGSRQHHQGFERLKQTIPDFERRAAKVLDQSQAGEFAHWRKLQHDAVALIRGLGGECNYSFEVGQDYEPNRDTHGMVEAWLRQLLKDDLPFAIVRVVMTANEDATLALLEPLKTLKSLTIAGAKVSDACLCFVSGLTGLRHVVFQLTNVTEADAAKLQKAVPNCKISR